MSDPHQGSTQPTAIDDVRRAREQIAQQHGGDFQGHIDETNRATAEARAKLGIPIAPVPKRPHERVGTGA